ncbi:MAG: DUF547 domain-containing protein [Burkholderiales bacterium]
MLLLPWSGQHARTMDPDRELPLALAAVAAHFDAEGLACDYAALAASRERGHLAVCLAALETFDPRQVRIAAQMAFWINVFNAGVLRDAPELALELEGAEPDTLAFFERPRLRIFGLQFSLDDIYHGLLRGNVAAHGRLQAPMRRDDPRLVYTPIAFDERVHFALFRGSRSSPAFRVFEDAATRYLRRLAQVAPDGSVLRLPRLLQWYAKDFGHQGDVLEFVLQRLDDASVACAERDIGRLNLRYDAYDWTLNRR